MHKSTEDFRRIKRLLEKYFPRSFQMGFIILFYAIFGLSAVYGSNTSIVRRIEIRGATNVGKEVILSRIPVVVGQSISDADLDHAVKNIYAMGYFSNVKIKIVDSVLIIDLIERKIINHLFFSGNNNLKDDQLKMIVRSRSAAAYDEDTVNADVHNIKQAYASIGYLNVMVKVQHHSISPTTLNITYVIEEGVKAKINSIRFVGNKNYSHARLERVISIRTSGYFSFGKTDVYSKERMSFDEEAIRAFYHDRGYAAVKVSSQVLFDKQKSGYVLIFQIDEGEIYTVGNISIQSTLQEIQKKTLLSLIRIRSGNLYNPQEIKESSEKISKYFFSGERPFVRVKTRINRDFAKRIVDIEYLIDQGSPLYVKRIEIEGNDQSYDSVIRRELELSEGDPINYSMIERAKRRIMATGYFSEVNISQLPANDVSDYVILRVSVKQLSAGSVGIATNYEVDKGMGVEGHIDDNNFFGQGYRARLAAGFGRHAVQNYTFSVEDPYFLGSPISAGFDLQKTHLEDGSLDINDESAAVRMIVPITESISTSFKYDLRFLQYGAISEKEKIPSIYTTLIEHGKFSSHSISQSIIYNTLDNPIVPRKGMLISSSYDYAGFGGDSQYHRIGSRASYFYLLSDDSDIVGSLRFGYGCVIPSNKNLQLFDQFSVSSNYYLRGFAYKGIGPRVDKKYAIGGKIYSSASAAVSFPMPLVPERAGLRGAFFVDSATLYANHVALGADKLEGNDSFWRVSTGVEIMWNSPLGMMGVYYGIPLRHREGDKIQQFGFRIGNRM
ncbi:outer membrane protein assembly factor BamA [Candidatus Liberibacter asiaticus]|uniref:Outer membrane protein assembly factor BamA n=43 Tax=Liberibacter asiaticus TaxID=34021 RepID=C6XFU2_LIBAP|nr:outer membrane protein assembly factor BamA [Candidatus Liberibacter asiaticus]AAX47433.1 outer membrane protein [Candidatus Liberibacter asiaticus]ACT57245.1 surface antigen (D15) [Candidatus Liberibacter asiaticus str. psy62]AEG67282.1 outer membrane protein [Candidatus Liberibacter asiaticus]AFN07667.1 outer membrane protein [Candidatus Liberibacter asiaticus]AFN07670.1 outer membrane protein [Candidatus Liberibacter asiaticus]